MSPEMTPRARSLLFFGGTVVAALVFIRLGVWQLSRLAERRAINATALAARDQPPLALDTRLAQDGGPGGGLDNRRVSVSGRYDHAAEIVIRGQSEGGVPGVRLVTPLRPLSGDTALLVQRGYYPSPDARTVNLAAIEEPGVVWVRGIAFPLDTAARGEPLEQGGQLSWRRVDLRAIRERLPYPVAPFVILQEADSTAPRGLRRDEPPALDDGPHLSYAIQWFSFAITALVVGGIVGFGRGSKA